MTSKRRRIANRNAKRKMRQTFMTVEAVTFDGYKMTVKVPICGEFVVTDADGTKRIFQRCGTYQNTVKRGLAALKLTTRTVRSARVILPT